jgi:hypothetical protein
LVIELGLGDLNFGRLTECQGEAAAGLYAQAMAAYVAWIAPRFEQVTEWLKIEVVRLRDEISRELGEGQHRRTPTLVADLIGGFNLFLKFAEEIGAVNNKQAVDARQRARLALVSAAADQAEHQSASDPCRRYFDLLRSALSSGRAHVAASNGECPSESQQAWGWRRREDTNDSSGEWQYQGKCIGWVENENLYLDPDAAYAEANRLAGDQGESLPVTLSTLHRRLHEGHLLASVDQGRKRLKIRRTLAGSRRDVLHLRTGQFLGTDPSGPSVPDGPCDENPRVNGPLARVASGPLAENRHASTSQNRRETATIGPNGPLGPWPAPSSDDTSKTSQWEEFDV